MFIEKIYKCRSCEQRLSIIEEYKGSVDVPPVINTTECKNCCVNTTNGCEIKVVADLIKYIKS